MNFKKLLINSALTDQSAKPLVNISVTLRTDQIEWLVKKSHKDDKSTSFRVRELIDKEIKKDGGKK